MDGKAFNLLDEPWIRVMMPDCTVREVSLTEALTQAHTFSALAGELPTQDVAVLRLLLAVLHTVFSRVDETGKEHPFEEAENALDRWKALWHAGQFPSEPICAYLQAWHERFYLFHPERPFYQVKEADRGTEFTAAKLNGAISESSNKVRLFSMRVGAEKESLSFPEAARWLLYLNGFDDTSAKPKQKDLPSPGAGWLGKLGLIAAQGDNLYETLMLNLVLLKDNSECWGKNVPIWELDQARTQERCEIPMPDNQAQLLTLQSRRLLLLREGDRVVGYKLLGGDFFSKVNAYSEQMTVWMKVQGKGSQPNYDQPKRHDPSKKMWREFSTMFVNNETRLPGVVVWMKMLNTNKSLQAEKMARFQIASVQYGDKDFFVTDVFSDELGFHLGLLTEAGKVWVSQIESEIGIVDKLARDAMFLGANIEQASGGSGDALGRQLKEQFYDRIDVPFRKFLASVNPADDQDQRGERVKAWRQEARRIAHALGKEAVSQAGQHAFVGRMVEDRKKGSCHCSLPEAYNLFLACVNKHLEDKGKE